MMKYTPLWLPIFLLLTGNYLSAQPIATFTLTNHGNTVGVPVYVDLDPLTYVADSSLTLTEVTDGKNIPVPFQIEHGYHRFLWWVITNEHAGSSGVRKYKLEQKAHPAAMNQAITVTDDSGALIIKENGKNVLQYNYKTHYPPAGVDTAFKRSGFIHPLWSPVGNILTQINPPDHRHHMGIWNPWTDVLFQGKMVDFWNLGDKKGTVRFDHFIAKESGAVWGGFKALQQHIVLPDAISPTEKTAMNEVWDVRVYNVGDKMWLWDFTSTLNCAGNDSVLLKEYRYGGFGFRATADWNNKNSKVLTSEGKTRKEADAGTARWCMIDGDMQQGHSGILFMSYPANYNFPEPMRVWPEDMNGRGDVFFSFSPTRNTDWLLMPGKSYVLKYRMLVFDNTITPEQAEQAWQSFAHPPAIAISKK